MISDNMNKVLKNIPYSPNKTDLKNLSKKNILDINLLASILNEAVEYGYIQFCDKINPYRNVNKNTFYLTEAGQVAIEEYKNQKGSSKKATIALIISGLSFLASVAAIIISVFVV